MRLEERAKGDEVRSRLVFRQYNKGKLDEMFAATPTSIGLQLLLAISSALGSKSSRAFRFWSADGGYCEVII